jgi:hypothetical protein
MSQTPQRRPYVNRTSSFVRGVDSPAQVLEECLAEIDQREAPVGAFTVIEAQAARMPCRVTMGGSRLVRACAAARVVAAIAQRSR